MGLVYVVKMNGTDFYKIGYTNNDLDGRLKAFSTYFPLGCTVEAIIESAKPLSLERDLHEKFKVKRVSDNREFFLLIKEDIDYLKSLQKKDLIDFINYCYKVYFEVEDKSKVFGIIKPKEYNNKTSFNYDSLTGAIINRFKGEFVSSADLYLFCCDLLTEEEIEKTNRRAFGSFFKENFESKMKKINGSVTRGYLI